MRFKDFEDIMELKTEADGAHFVLENNPKFGEEVFIFDSPEAATRLSARVGIPFNDTFELNRGGCIVKRRDESELIASCALVYLPRTTMR
jgi:hypothetical protein